MTRFGLIVALIAGGAAACHYKAGQQYKEEKEVPGADSGSRRIVTTAAPTDSTNTLAGPATAATVTPSVATASSASLASPESSASPASSASSGSRATTKPVTKAKFSRGRASVNAPKIYGSADVAPEFPGGQRGLDNYIDKSVNYPQQAIDDDVSGVVHVSFVIDETGHVTKAKVMDAAKPADGLDKEALRVVRSMPSWTPGKIKGKNVKTRMELPISFVLES